MARSTRNIVIDWSDVKNKFIECVQHGKDWSSQPAMNDNLRRLHDDPYGDKAKARFEKQYADYVERNKHIYKDRWKRYTKSRDEWMKYTMDESEWEGGTGADTLKWLREGFFAPEFAHAAEYVPTALKTRNVWNEEEGDVDAGALIAGKDDFYIGAQKRLSKPGLRVQIEFAFAWTVSAKTIQEYGAWCAGFLGALEQEGYDLVVDMWIPLDNLYSGDTGVRSNVLVRVKRPNEVSDFTEWSALFSPTGYRQLGFTAKCVAGDKIGKRANASLGHTIGGKTWGVDYDKETALVMLTVNQRAGGSEKFPKDHLNKQAVKAGLLPGM